ncbi:hypothetical protein [Nocardiopsis sp. LOL_012]|uniref:hypothetical protein n=1 Tax=Nocardiopsis sp. LOL_012 TaxID=3345409 RepID=UPI003A8448E4
MTEYHTVREAFTGQHLTGPLLQELARTGPGGLITANAEAGEYRLSHHRWLQPTPCETIVYGYGDLLHDLDWASMLPHTRAWTALVSAADHAAHACLEWGPWDPARLYERRGLERLRTLMGQSAFTLMRRPLFCDTDDLLRLHDTYLDTEHPALQVTIATSYPDAEAFDADAFTWIADRGVFVTGWRTPARELCHLPRRVRAVIAAHLASGT